VIAGVLGAKKTSELIPFCHPLPLNNIGIATQWHSCPVAQDGSAVLRIDCTAVTEGKTGVEMEALTGASIAALTVYDMCKALSHEISIRHTRLLSKTGGKSDFGVGSQSH
jgi:cyclic pyranopterin phosphate synthase